MSVTLLYLDGKRRSDHAIRTQTPAVGYLLLEPQDRYGRRVFTARLQGSGLAATLLLEEAVVAEVRGRAGMRLVGIEYRAKGRKHSIADHQEWWCQAPPRTGPLVDTSAIIRAAEEAHAREHRQFLREAGEIP